MDTVLLEKFDYVELDDGGIQINKGKDKSITEIVIPEGVTVLGNRAFGSFIKLRKVTLPSTLKKLCGFCFGGCINLAEINLPEGLEVIESGAFSMTSDLKVVNVPKTVTELDGYAFNEAHGLTAINVDPENPKFRSIDGVLYNAEGDTLIYYPECKKGDFTVPESVKSINSWAFKKCHLGSLYIGEGVTSIFESAFELARSLDAITVAENNPRYRSDSNALYTKDGKTLIKYAITSPDTEMTILPEVTSINQSAFAYSTKLERVIAPDGLKKIDRYGFYNAEGLKSIELGNGVEDIAGEAFSGCKNLQSISFPDSIRTIGDNAFFGCSSLVEISLPNSLTYLGNRPFIACNAITKLTYDGTTAEWEAINKTVCGIPEEAKLVLLRDPAPVEEPVEEPIEEAPADEPAEDAPEKKDNDDKDVDALFNEIFGNDDKPKEEAKEPDEKILSILNDGAITNKPTQESAAPAPAKKKGLFARLFGK